ncbi:GLEYA motif domain-containing protein [Hirsutella rhossiliensis]
MAVAGQAFKQEQSHEPDSYGSSQDLPPQQSDVVEFPHHEPNSYGSSQNLPPQQSDMVEHHKCKHDQDEDDEDEHHRDKHHKGEHDEDEDDEDEHHQDKHHKGEHHKCKHDEDEDDEDEHHRDKHHKGEHDEDKDDEDEDDEDEHHRDKHHKGEHHKDEHDKDEHHNITKTKRANQRATLAPLIPKDTMEIRDAAQDSMRKIAKQRATLAPQILKDAMETLDAAQDLFVSINPDMPILDEDESKTGILSETVRKLGRKCCSGFFRVEVEILSTSARMWTWENSLESALLDCPRLPPPFVTGVNGFVGWPGVYGAGETQIYGQGIGRYEPLAYGVLNPPYGTSEFFLIEWSGYFVPKQSGQYIFEMNFADDLAYLWLGSKASCGFNPNNADVSADYWGLPKDGEHGPGWPWPFKFQATANQAIPIRIILAQSWGEFALRLSVKDPQGRVIMFHDSPSSDGQFRVKNGGQAYSTLERWNPFNIIASSRFCFSWHVTLYERPLVS